MNNHTNQSQLTNDADFTLDSITVTMTNQSTCYNKFSLFTVRLSNCCVLKKTAISYKKKMDEKPIRQKLSCGFASSMCKTQMSGSTRKRRNTPSSPTWSWF